MTPELDLSELAASIGTGPTAAQLLLELGHIADGLEVEPALVSDRTRAAYESDWGQWQSWCELHEVSSLPVDPELVRLYVADMITQVRADGTRRFRPSTVERHLASLAWRSRAEGGVHDLARHPRVSPVLAGARLAKPPAARAGRALTSANVAALVEAMSHHTWPHGVASCRDTFIVLAARQTGLRRGQLASLTVRDGAALDLPRDRRPLMCARCARVRWLRMLAARTRAEGMRLVFGTGPCSRWSHVCADSADGALDSPLSASPDCGAPGAGSPLLRAVTRTGEVEERPLTGAAVAQLVKRRLVRSGLDPGLYGSNSLLSPRGRGEA